MAYVGDANNVWRSLAIAASMSGHRHPGGLAGRLRTVARDVELVRSFGGGLVVDRRPGWRRSAGWTPSTPTCGPRWARRTRHAARLAAFAGYQVDEAPAVDGRRPTPWSSTAFRPTGARRSAPGWWTAPSSVVWLQAANRMHAMRGLLAWVMAAASDRRTELTRAVTKTPAPAPHHQAAGDQGRGQPGATWSSSWPPKGSTPPRPRCRATSRSSAPSRSGCPGGETAYALPELPSHQVAPEDHLRRVLGEWVVEADYSGNLVVLRTPPGSAHVVGSALDRSGFPGRHRHGRRRRHRAGGGLGDLGRRRGRRPAWPAVAGLEPTGSDTAPARIQAAARPEASNEEPRARGEHDQASGAGLQRRTGHLGGRPLADREPASR